MWCPKTKYSLDMRQVLYTQNEEEITLVYENINSLNIYDMAVWKRERERKRERESVKDYYDWQHVTEKLAS